MTAGRGRTIVFFPEGAFGPTNNCVGIGEVLRARGHRVVFIVEESFAGTLAARGFEERLMRLAPAPAEPEVPGQFWKDFIHDTAPQFRRPTIDQLASFLEPTWRALVDGAMYVEPRLRELLDELAPDAIVEDNVVAFPALAGSGRPWVRIVSCNPAELKDEAVPPVFSGYGDDDRAAWPAFREAYRRTHADLWAGFAEFVQANGGGSLADGPLGPDFITPSPWLDLYVYPAELDYRRAVPLSPTWHRLESCVRDSGAAFELPAVLAGRDDPLVYLSLGSLGSADVGLMQRLIDLLAAAPLRVIVSLGPQHDQLRLPSSMWGAEFVPQPAILPLVDVVITHGGNNTVTECLHHGKPMVVLPLFWDQYDNAQRIHDLGFGVRLPTYTFPDDALVAAVMHLHGDRPLRTRLAAIAGRLQAAPGTVRAADLIERLAVEQRPVEHG